MRVIKRFCGDNGAFYKAFIVDIDDKTTESSASVETASTTNSNQDISNNTTDVSKIKLSFENDWRPQQKFSINRIRLPPNLHSSVTNSATADHSLSASSSASSIANSTTANSIVNSNADQSVPPIITEGMVIEVLSCTKDGEQYGWSRGSVEMIVANGSIYGVQSNNSFEIVKGHRIRLINPNPLLSTNPFYKFELKVPDDIRSVTTSLLTNAETHKQLKESIGAIVVRFDEPNGMLICIGYAPQEGNETSREASRVISAVNPKASDWGDLPVPSTFGALMHYTAFVDESDSEDSDDSRMIYLPPKPVAKEWNQYFKGNKNKSNELTFEHSIEMFFEDLEKSKVY